MVVSIGSKSAEIDDGQGAVAELHRYDHRVDVVQLFDGFEVRMRHCVDRHREVAENPADHVDVVNGAVVENSTCVRRKASFSE